jgi:tRNA nucleotidyltransferase/poly(A) polymerase
MRTKFEEYLLFKEAEENGDSDNHHGDSDKHYGDSDKHHGDSDKKSDGGGSSGGSASGPGDEVSQKAKSLITSKIKLQKKEGSNEFAPFTVDRASHPNLRYLIKAFADSDKVGLGYTTIDKTKGEMEPMLKKKTLHLTGGAVRDHLKGKTPRNYDLVTDATPSEMRMILSNPEHGFTEVQPRDPKLAQDERYHELPPAGSRNKVFYPSRWDKQGKELEFTVEINGEKFDLATLSKHSKSRRVSPDKGESASSVEEDSLNRDFTINGMYIPLNQSDGENSDLVDPHGGAHHLKNGEVVAIGSLIDKLRADPSTSQRYVKMLSRFGNPDKIPDKYKATIERYKDMQDVDKGHVRKEFLSGLENPDVDPRKYLGAYSKLGLMGAVFPGHDFNPDEMPPDFKGDRWLAPAWVLRKGDPQQVMQMLVGQGWSKQEAQDITHLIKMAQWADKGFDADQMYDLKNSHNGLTKNKQREWMQMIGKQGNQSDAYFMHDDKDLAKMVDGPDGKKQINPKFHQHLGRTPKPGELEGVRKDLSKNRFVDMLNKLKHHKAGGEDKDKDKPFPSHDSEDKKQEWVSVAAFRY